MFILHLLLTLKGYYHVYINFAKGFYHVYISFVTYTKKLQSLLRL